MEQDIYFMPLGGGQRVGASCYYLRIGDTNIILDAGVGRENGMEFEPDFYTLVTSPFLQSMSQINQIYISHAHADHVGYLLKLMKHANRADVYMTEITKLLSEFQLYDKLYFNGRNVKNEGARLAAKSLLEKVATVSYMQKMDFGKYKVLFFPAGHIPGAMMILFDTGKRKILYTGDYSLDSTLLTGGCLIPSNIQIDTIIMCGLHAKHPDYAKKADKLYRTVHYVLKSVESRQQSILCNVAQLSKGLEFLKVLNERNHSGIPIYVDRSVMRIVSKMEKLSIPVLNQYNKVMGEEIAKEPHIYVTSDPRSRGFGFYQEVKVHFSLHEDFDEMKKFIKKVNPKQALVVHCAKEYSVFDSTIEQAMMADSECRTQFIFAEEKEIYRL